MPEIHPDNHPNDPYFPREEYNRKKAENYPNPLIFDEAFSVAKFDEGIMTVEEARRIVHTSPRPYDWKAESYPVIEVDVTQTEREKIALENMATYIKENRASLVPEDYEKVIDQRPLFITFEGGEGSGKSTQSKRLYEYLKTCNVPVFWTREPGGTDFGSTIRNILLSQSLAPKSKMAELMMFAADRAEHVETVILPKLQEGYVVLCDRFSASTIAYQSYAHGLDLETVEYICQYASMGLEPDRVIYLDVDPAIGLERAGRVERTRFEDMTLEYHKKVRAGFHAQMKADFLRPNQSWMWMDAHRPIEQVHLLIRNEAFRLCKEYGYLPEQPAMNTNGEVVKGDDGLWYRDGVRQKMSVRYVSGRLHLDFTPWVDGE